MWHIHCMTESLQVRHGLWLFCKSDSGLLNLTNNYLTRCISERGASFLGEDTKRTGTQPGCKASFAVAKLCNYNMTWCTVAQKYLFSMSLHCERSGCKQIDFFFSVTHLRNDLLTIIIWAIRFNNICKSWKATCCNYFIPIQVNLVLNQKSAASVGTHL